MRVHSKLKAWIVVLFLCVTVSACSIFSLSNRNDAMESMMLDFETILRLQSADYRAFKALRPV
jgi:hypothetical protein